MRILFIIGDLIGGGSERAVSLISSELARRGHSVSIACFPNNDNSYPIDDSIKIIKLKKYGDIFRDLFFRSYVIRKVIKKEKPEVTISFTTQKNVCTLLGSLFTKNIIIVSERNDPNRDPKKRVLRTLRKLLYRLSDGYVFQTEEARNCFSPEIQAKGTVIPNSLNDAMPPPYVGDRSKRIVTVGRLFPEKNLQLGILAFEEISKVFKDYHYEIYGEGPCRDELEKLISEHRLTDKVFLMGFSENVFDKIKDAQAFIFPSDYEGISNALMEALALGIPSISTDHPIGGARVLIRNGYNGFLVPVGDVDAMKEKMKWLLEHKDEAEEMGKNAVAYMNENFNISSITDKWEAYIKRIVVK